MIALLVALAAAQQATVTYFEPAAPLSRLIPSLSKALNQPLEVSQILKSDVVSIDVHDVAPKLLLAKIAWATGAVWQPTKSGGLLLSPSEGLRATQATEELNRRAAQVFKSLNPVPIPGEDQVSDSVGAGVLDSLPLLKSFDPKLLASIVRGGRVVFSTRPNRMQYAFPMDVTAIINETIAKYNHKIEVAAKEGDFSEYERDSIPKPITQAVDKVLLIVTPPTGDSASVQAVLRIFDSTGKDLCQNQGSSSGDEEGFTSPDSPGERVKLSPETRLVANLVAEETGRFNSMESLPTKVPPPTADRAVDLERAWGNDFQLLRGPLQNIPTTPPMSEAHRAEAISLFLDPEHHDPLSYASDVLRGLAASKKEQYVACLSDSFGTEINLALDGNLNSNELLESLRQNYMEEVISADGWLVARPRNPVEAEAERIDRHQLGQVIRMLQSRDYLRLEDELAVANLGYGLSEDSLVDLWCSVARPTIFHDSNGPDLEMVRFYAALTDGQRAKLETDKRLTVSPLTQEQAAVLYRLAYGQGSRISLEVPEGFTDSSIGNPEPTEIVPNGVPASVDVTLDETDDELVQSTDRLGPKFRRALGVEPIVTDGLITSAAQMAARPERSQSRSIGIDIDMGGFGPANNFLHGLPANLRFGTRKTLGLQIWLTPKVTTYGSLQIDSMSDEKIISYAELRKQHKEDYDKAYAAALKAGGDVVRFTNGFVRTVSGNPPR